MELKQFQSTPPVRGATKPPPVLPPPLEDFNPRPPCGGRRQHCPHRFQRHRISIHAPRAGGDRFHRGPCRGRCYFNPRPPCGGRLHPRNTKPMPRHFNPRPPCGGRPSGASVRPATSDFNPRPPCGGRPNATAQESIIETFQSTPPVRGATPFWTSRPRRTMISIHAPRAGGDSMGL